MDLFVPGTGNEPVTNAPQNNAPKEQSNGANTNASNAPNSTKEQTSTNLPKEQKAVTNAPDSHNSDIKRLLEEASVYLSHLAMQEKGKLFEKKRTGEKITDEDVKNLENALENAGKAATLWYQYGNEDVNKPTFVNTTKLRDTQARRLSGTHNDDYYTTDIRDYSPEEILKRVFKEAGKNPAYLNLPATIYDDQGNRRIPADFSIDKLQPPAPSASVPPSPESITNAPTPKKRRWFSWNRKKDEEEERSRRVAAVNAAYGYHRPVTRHDLKPAPTWGEQKAATPEGEKSRLSLQAAGETIMENEGLLLSVDYLNEQAHDTLVTQGNINHWVPGMFAARGISRDPFAEQYGTGIARLGNVRNMSPEALQRQIALLASQGLAPEVKEEKVGVLSRLNPFSSYNREGSKAKKAFKAAQREAEGIQISLSSNRKEYDERRKKYDEESKEWDNQSVFKKLTSLSKRRRLDKEKDRLDREADAVEKYKGAGEADYTEALKRQEKARSEVSRYKGGYHPDELKSETSLAARAQRVLTGAEKSVVEIGNAYNPITGAYDQNAPMSPETTKVLRAKKQEDVIKAFAQDREFLEKQNAPKGLAKLKSGLGKIGGVFGRVAIAATAVVGVFKALSAFVKNQINKSFGLSQYNGRIGAAKAMFQGRQFMRDVRFAGDTADERVGLIDNWDQLMEQSQEAREDFAKLAIEFAQACIEAGKALVEFYHAIKELWDWLKSIPGVAKIIEGIENAAKGAKLDDGPTLGESIKGIKESKQAVKRGEDQNALINTGNLAREFYETGKINEEAFKKSTFAKKGMSKEDALKALNDESQRNSFEDLIAQNDIMRGSNFFQGYKGLDGAEATKENIQEKILGVLENIDASAHQSAVENAAARKAAEETASNTREKTENITSQPIFEAMMLGANRYAPTGNETLHAGNDTVNAWGAQAEKQYGRFAGEGVTIEWGTKGKKK